MKTFLQIIAAGCLVIMMVCIFSAACAIVSFRDAYCTYEAGIKWLTISWVIFFIAGGLSIALAFKADKLKK